MRSNTLLIISCLLLLLLPTMTLAQSGLNRDLPENMIIYIDRSTSLNITERSIVRSELNGENADTLAMPFGRASAMQYIAEANEYLLADPNGNRIIRVSSDFGRYKVVQGRIAEAVFAVDYDATRDRLFTG